MGSYRGEAVSELAISCGPVAGGGGDATSFSRPAVLRLLRRRYSNTSPRIVRPMTKRPPTTPPAIAPAGDALVWLDCAVAASLLLSLLSLSLLLPPLVAGPEGDDTDPDEEDPEVDDDDGVAEAEAESEPVVVAVIDSRGVASISRTGMESPTSQSKTV